ncbi:cobyrinate a,c-diamide synthase [Desulfovibrio sp. OttesenSCG-928-I05]|nr:cobyrinate a,c-diamide synthase [Desulfovibrio sp. OttesenSCG-928-I05]
MPDPNRRGFVVAASGTGSGKTTLTMALLAALVRRGLSPRPFKVGPDPLDSGLHAGVVTPVHSARIPNPGRNLDGWLFGKEMCRAIFERGMASADDRAVAVVEGVMGIFDGADAVAESGSTAEMAKWLNLPVLLILNAQGAGRTIAALVKGLIAFDPDVNYLGIVCNNVGSARHEAGLRRTLDALCPDIPLLGCFPRNEHISLPSRHLGLRAAHEGILMPAFQNNLVDWAERNMDIELLLEKIGVPGSCPPGSIPAAPLENIPLSGGTVSPPLRALETPVRLGVSCDEALYFLTEDNLYQLRAAGAELVFFSPLHDTALPPDLDGLYLCGGYPELHAETLSQNSGMLCALRDFAASGRPVWAAGGGFLYLLSSFTAPSSAANDSFMPFSMAGIFEGHASLEMRLQALGYREIHMKKAGLFGPEGTALRGNEFRYSRLLAIAEHYPTIFEALDRQGQSVGAEGFTLPDNPNVLGTFMHIHLGGTPGAAEHFVSHLVAAKRNLQ